MLTTKLHVFMVFFSQKRERVTVPLLKFLDQLLTSGFLDPLLEDDSSTFPSELLSLVKVIQSPFLA